MSNHSTAAAVHARAHEVPNETMPAPHTLRSNPRSKYSKEMVSLQSTEAVGLTVALLCFVSLTFYLWRFSDKWWCPVVIAGLGGIVAGLLHSLKWFYRTIGDGEWERDRAWWRYLNPLVSGVMGFSLYIVLRSGVTKSTIPSSNADAVLAANQKEVLIAYTVGFLTGLFADNAMNKLRDVAHVIFGSAGESSAKPQKRQKHGTESQ